MMETEKLIATLAADSRLTPLGGERGFLLIGVLGTLVTLAFFFGFLGPRPDLGSAVGSLRFLAKPLLAALLCAGALGTLLRLARPGAKVSPWLSVLLAAAFLLVAAVFLELAVVPRDLWAERLLGEDALACLALIPLMSAGPLIAFLCALRRAAPTRPALAGAVAGLAAAGLGASIYAFHCVDDSPLFLAVWYGAATLIVVAAGALLGRRLLRW